MVEVVSFLVEQPFLRSLVELFPECAAKRLGGHVEAFGELFHADCVVVVLIYVESEFAVGG